MTAGPMPGRQVIETVRAETDTVLLSFSCGKDSVAAWLAVRRHFPTVIPFYMQLIPGLSFVDEALAYYEEFFGCHIVRMIHPSLYRMLNHFVFQPPERCRIIEAAQLPSFDYDDVSRLIIEEHGLPRETFTLSGVRAADSPNRLSAIRQYGPINWRRRMAYPVWDLKKTGLLELFHRSGVKLPVDYEWFGRSFDGIDYRFLSVLREQSPADYAKVLAWFPLADAEEFRREQITS